MDRTDAERDTVVTGLGFCLPGPGTPTFTADDLWHIASRGQSCLRNDLVYYGSVGLTADMFDDRLPGLPEIFARHYTDAHRYGLVSLAEACADAGLDLRAGELGQAAILVGRGGIDANVDSYLAVLRADPATTGPLAAMEMFIAAEQAVSPSDVALVQCGLARASGPSFTISSGCCSSAVQCGIARRMIADGEVDVAAVTGVDVFNLDLVLSVQRLLKGLRDTYDTPGMTDTSDTPGAPELAGLLPSFDSLMRPYDRRAGSINHGEGAATLILESRSHARRRGAHLYGQILATAMTRDGLAHPLACDDTGSELARAVRACLGERWSLEQIPYVHGASDGNAVVTAFESAAIRELYGDAGTLLMTSQEGCFGHNGAPAGCLGVALTLLMMERGEVCPTANCDEPADGLPFDPVPGAVTRPLAFDRALTFNYQVGGVKNAILLGSPDTE